MAGVAQAQQVGERIIAARSTDARDGASLLTALRALGTLDDHGDPIDRPLRWSSAWCRPGSGAFESKQALLQEGGERGLFLRVE